MESTDGDIETVASDCAQKSSVDYDQITACTHSRLGNQLQHNYAVETGNLQPPHQFVPWITLNNQHTDDMQKQAEQDLIGLICNSYKVRFSSMDLSSSDVFFFRDLIHQLNAQNICELCLFHPFFFSLHVISFFFIQDKERSLFIIIFFSRLLVIYQVSIKMEEDIFAILEINSSDLFLISFDNRNVITF